MLDTIPEALIARGVTQCRARAGLSRAWSRDEGPATITRTDLEIVVDGRRGTLKIAAAAEAGQVQVSLPNGVTYSGALQVEVASVVFVAASGHRVTLSRGERGIEVALSGFGAADHFHIFLDS